MRFIAYEMNADASDCRPLGWSGDFLTGSFSESDVALFHNADSAINQATQARNARPGCRIETIPRERKVRA